MKNNNIFKQLVLGFVVYQVSWIILIPLLMFGSISMETGLGYVSLITGLFCATWMLMLLYRKDSNILSIKFDFSQWIMIFLAVVSINISQQIYFHLVYLVSPESLTGLDNAARDMLKAVPISIIGVTFFGPIIEELTFRYGLFHWLNRRISNWWITSSITSATFAFLHGQFIAFPVYFLIGLCFSGLYRKTNKITAPIIVHILSNFIAIIL